MKARHRVPHLGSRLRRYDDPSHSPDPRVRAVVARLRAVELPAPETNFRAELRAQLVAVAPRLVADGIAEQQQAERVGESRVAEEPESPRRRIHFGRPLAVLTTLVAVCALVLGGAVWLSQKALPGDTLYGLKRASESVELKLDTNDTDRATDYLHFSQRRVEEAQDLLHRASAAGAGISADGISAETATELKSTLAAADSQLLDGWKLLKATATASHSSTPLATMTDWAPGQVTRLTALEGALGKGAVLDRARQSTAFVHTAVGLAKTLKATLDKPTSAPALPTPGTHQTAGGAGKTGSRAAQQPARTHGSAAAKTSTVVQPSSSATPSASQSQASTTDPSSTHKGLLPSLIRPLDPAGTPLIGSCGVSLPGGLKVGRCTTHS